MHTLAIPVRYPTYFRVGYFVNNDYESEELRENPPEVPEISNIHRLGKDTQYSSRLKYRVYLNILVFIV